MGSWGTAISSNDTYADIYSEFIDLYNHGHSITEITSHLIDTNQETINTYEEVPNFWFALANAQWECKALSHNILLKVEDIITSGEDLKIWKDLEASPKDLLKREEVLNKFLTKIRVEKDKPRKRVKKKLFDSIFKKGDCLTYIMDNGNYGGAFVLSDEQNSEVGKNYIAITTIDKSEKPTINDFTKAEIYVKNENETTFKNGKIEKYIRETPQIAGFYSMVFKKHGIEIEVIGQISTQKEFTMERERASPWSALKSAIPFKEEYIKINGPVKKSLKLIELIKYNPIETFKKYLGF